MTDRLSFFAPCPRGIEPLLADELRRVRVRGVRPQRAGVLFSGDMGDAYRALLWSRLASRVLLSLGDADAVSADALYAWVREVPWEDHVSAGGTIAVDASGTNAALRDTRFTAVRVKDAIADRFRDRVGSRPSVDVRRPDLRINVVVRESSARISIDLSGEPLHRRGYREQGVQVAAPMKETLAAAVLTLAGWKEIAEQGGALLDPMCGSATLPIEAALMAADIAPGLLRSSAAWGFSRWLGFDPDLWERLTTAAEERRERGLRALPPIWGSDSDGEAISIARACVLSAGLEGHVALRPWRLSEIERPDSREFGLVVSNPPYGQRLAERAHLPALYAELATRLRGDFAGWRVALISPDERLAAGLGMKAEREHDLYNGRILSPLRVFTVPASGALAAGDSALHAAPVDPSATAFANRLRKMSRHYGQWARRTGVTCYRIYDADLPDYNVAVDVYTGAGSDEGHAWAHVAEYAPPAGIDPERAAARLASAVATVAEVLALNPAAVFVKRRERQRGAAQYERQATASVVATVAEGGLLFEVNLSDYLDTGIFLDHRDTRAWVRELAAGKRFLNLFAYTGTATVYAAAGGATGTTTVDLSTTYLEWAQRNLARNGMTGSAHEFVRADVTAWLADAAARGERYGLVFCDPPTFSNSKRMEGTWDVQRDHVDLITAAARLLTDDGTLLFSCNRRKFDMDVAALETRGFEVRDVTRRTIPKDFERTPWVHSCWTVSRAGAR